MAETVNHSSHQIDHLFRHEYGKLVAVLTKTFGPSNLQLAEDVVQEAMLEALNKWSYNGIPDNPVGWIYSVAKNKAINIIKREKYVGDHVSEIEQRLHPGDNPHENFDDIFTESEIADDQLSMIFTCCHPSISQDSQVALTLKTLCGFNIPEIARAFLSTEENINKRLVRARQAIRSQNVKFEVPVGSALQPRLSSVLETIYLLFNEGYNATSGKKLIRYELCEEAIRMAEIVATQPQTSTSQVYALLALMTLNSSRFNAREDEDENILDLEHQDRNKWDKKLIARGLEYLEFATKQNEISLYLILAAISAQHCTALDYASTDWHGILELYEMLLALEPSPLIKLNHAIVLSKTGQTKAAIHMINSIRNEPTIQSYLPYYTAKAQLLYDNKQTHLAVETLENALKLKPNEKVISLINSKIEDYSK
ncbi:MAG: sigma-70 family RNA polymerase sigma factor [Cyclobacteriaceae bacterium]